MDFGEIFFNIKYKIWIVFTWGWIAWVFFTICFLGFIFTLFYIFSNYNIIKYTIKEKILFIKSFIYIFMYANIHFIKFWLKDLLLGFNKQRNLYILFAIVGIIIISVFIAIRMNK